MSAPTTEFTTVADLSARSRTGGQRPFGGLSMKGWSAVAVTSSAIVALALHARTFLPFIADDSLISLRYSKRLLDGQGLTWTDGEYVEGYSNLLWVLGCAFMGWLGLDLIQGARILGTIAMSSVLAAVAWSAMQRSEGGLLSATVGVLTLAAAGPIAVWCVGGMEIALLVGLLAWALVLGSCLVSAREPCAGRTWLIGTLLGLVCLTRPDGIMYPGAAAVAILVTRGVRNGMPIAARLMIVPVGCVLGQLAFRWWYYEALVPNTVFAKASVSPRRLSEGIEYITGAWSLSPLMVAALGAAFGAAVGYLDWRRLVWLLVPFLAWTLAVVLIGGDNFPFYRHLVPQVVIGTLMALELVATAVRRRPRRTLIVAVAGLATFTVLQWRDPERDSVKSERFEWDAQVVGNLLKKAFGPQRPLLAVDVAGSLPYFSELPALDMLGLNDRYLAHHRPPTMGQGELGHELGNGAYVFGRQPDLVIPCSPNGEQEQSPGVFDACYRSGQELFRMSAFQKAYDLVFLQGEEPYRYLARVRVRRESPRIGIQRSPNRVFVPGFLLATTPDVAARLHPSGRFGAAASARPIHLADLNLPDGCWEAFLDTSRPLSQAIVRDVGSGNVLRQGTERLRFDVGPGGTRVAVTAVPRTGDDTWVFGITFARLTADSEAGVDAPQSKASAR